VAAGLVAGIALLAAPASAQDDKSTRVQPKPKVADARTTFVVRSTPVGPDTGFGGDGLNLEGPKGTRCEGSVLSSPVGHLYRGYVYFEDSEGDAELHTRFRFRVR
jgi:hypothetical protein